VDTRFGKVELKKVVFPGRGEARYAPEFESCRRLAQEASAPLQEVYREALLQAGLMMRGERDREAQAAGPAQAEKAAEEAK